VDQDTAPDAKQPARLARLGSLPAALVTDLLAAAVSAPSIHGSQPWGYRVRRYSHTIELRADPSQALPCGDPSGRSVHVACGAALLNLRLAASIAAREPVVKLLPDPKEPVLLATVRLAGPHRALPIERELYAAITSRRAGPRPRGGRRAADLPLAELVEAARIEGAFLHVLGHDEAIRVLSVMRDFQVPGLDGPAPLRDLVPHQPNGGASVDGAPRLAVLSAHLGDRANWLRAGQALQRVLLTATARGVDAGPLTEPLDTADARLIRSPDSGDEQPQMIVRIGFVPQFPSHPPAPRRPASEVFN